MSAWLQVRQRYSETVEDGVPNYSCALEVIDSHGIAKTVFVWAVTTTTYNHVATVDEMQMYPLSAIDAAAASKAFYRQTTALLSAASPTLLQEAVTWVLRRLRELCLAQSDATNLTFPSETTTIVGDS